MPQLIIQPSSIDSYIREANPNTNYGTETYMLIQATVDSIMRGLVNINFSTLPNYVGIDSSYFSLYYYSRAVDPVGKAIRAYLITQPLWTEGGVTWNKYDGATAWTTTGGDYSGSPYATVNMPANVGWVTWDVTTLVQYAQINTSKIAYFIVKFNDEATDANAWFYSKNYAVDTTLCPKLVTNYHYLNGLWFGNA